MILRVVVVIAIIVLPLLLACGEEPAPPDARSLGTCEAAPYPAVTLCADRTGWCVEGQCWPQCPCDGPEAWTEAGACYCP